MTSRANNRNAIVEAAATLIQTRGVQGTSISDIVQESGTSAGAIYHHFPNKNAVVVEVARQALAWPLSALETYRAQPKSPARLITYALDALTAVPELCSLLIALGAGSSTDDELGHLLRAEFAALRDSLDLTLQAWAAENGVPAERIAGYSQVMIGLTLGYATQQTMIDGFDAARYREQAVRLLDVIE